MAQQWEGLLEGAAQELKGHLTLERVTASKAGDEIAVFFSSDMLVEEKPFLAAQRAIRRNFAPTRVKLIIRSPQLAQDFLNDCRSMRRSFCAASSAAIPPARRL